MKGSGISTMTLSDLVRRLEILKWNGEKVIIEGDELQHVACHFGMLGFIVSMDIQCIPMIFAHFQPQFLDINTVSFVLLQNSCSLNFFLF